MHLFMIWNKRTSTHNLVMAKNARRAKMLLCLANEKVRMPELKVERRYLLGDAERIIN